MDIKIEVDDEGVKKSLRELSERVEDLTPVMKRIGELLVSSVQENFNREGRYSEPGSWRGGSKRWKPLAPSTIKQGILCVHFTANNGEALLAFVNKNIAKLCRIRIFQKPFHGILSIHD